MVSSDYPYADRVRTMHQILLIDDDLRLGELLTQYFKQFSLTITHVLTPGEGFNRLTEGRFDLVILDVMLPEMDGFEVCKKIRKTSEIPIIMLTARGEVMDRVVGIELGADDYLPKPFEPRELIVRIQSILKRTGNITRTTIIQSGDLKIDANSRQASIKKSVISLTAMEFDLLLLLARSPNKVFHRDEILNQLKGIDNELYSRSIDILISRLRAKLKPENVIQTVRGSGYCFTGKQAW